MAFWRKDAPAVGRAKVPPPAEIEDTAASVKLEHDARHAHALRLIHRTLITQRLLEQDDRNTELVDLCLDLRSALRSAPADAEVLRELPPVQLRYAVPVVPGRAS